MKINLRTIGLVTVLGCTAAAGSASADTSLLQDGTFLQSIGTGSHLTPWSDWTSAGVATHTAPTGIPGNYASVPFNGDLFQQFAGPATGLYTLSFLVQNASPWASELVVSVQRPGGVNWTELIKVLDLTASTDFVRQTYTFNVYQPEGTPTEFYFSNSYDDPNYTNPDDPNYPSLRNSVNPRGTIINVADVSITPYDAGAAVPEPGVWALMIVGFGAVGGSLRLARKRARLTPVI